MTNKTRKPLTLQMMLFELRNITGNPYVHLFGIAMPVFMSYIIIRGVTMEISDPALLCTISTSIFLGMGVVIPMAIALMGYAATRSQEMEKGIPERLELFGIRSFVTLCNRIAAELLFILIAFAIYFVYGCLFFELESPKVSGVVIYTVSMLALTVILLCIAHGIATLLKKFGPTYCIVMILYFAFMLLSGMMGLSYDNMPAGIQFIAKLLPTTYLNKDIHAIWTGESYRFAAMLQSYLLWAVVAGILLVIANSTFHSPAKKIHTLQKSDKM